MEIIIWYIISFIFLLVFRQLQYFKIKGAFFALTLSIIDLIIVTNPILTYIGKNYFYSIIIGILYFWILISYIPYKHKIFKKKNIPTGKAYIFGDIFMIIICFSLYSTARVINNILIAN